MLSLYRAEAVTPARAEAFGVKIEAALHNWR